MQIVSTGDSLIEMSNSVLWGKIRKKDTILSPAELAQRAVKVNVINSVLPGVANELYLN